MGGEGRDIELGTLVLVCKEIRGIQNLICRIFCC